MEYVKKYKNKKGKGKSKKILDCWCEGNYEWPRTSRKLGGWRSENAEALRIQIHTLE